MSEYLGDQPGRIGTLPLLLPYLDLAFERPESHLIAVALLIRQGLSKAIAPDDRKAEPAVLANSKSIAFDLGFEPQRCEKLL